jgi:outer membrane protein TolC
VEASVARGRLEQEEAANALEVARARMTITERAVSQSGEAHRIVIRKYEGGLATAVELFDAAAAETGARLGYAEARHQAIVALALRRRATGRSLDVLTSLDSMEP